MNQETNETDPNVPGPDEGNSPDLKETVSWFLNVALKVGAGYLAKMIMDALGF